MISVEVSSGPTSAPGGRPGVGFDGADCLHFRCHPSDAPVERITVAAVDHSIGPLDRLVYVIFPALSGSVSPENPRGGLDATAVCLDLVFDDGTRLSELGVVDHHGVAIDPRTMWSALTLAPDQWNRVEVGLAGLAGRRVLAIEIAAAPEGPCEGWIDGLALRAVPPMSEPAACSPLAEVSILRGTHSTDTLSRGNTAPAIARPNGFHLVLPVTAADDNSWPYTFQRDLDDNGTPGLEAFAISHTASPWLGDRGVLHFFPVSANLPRWWSPRARRRGFARHDEHARPHLYDVSFSDGGRARVTTSHRAALAEFFFTDRQIPAVVLSFPAGAHGFDLTRVTEGVITGWTNQGGLLPDGSTPCHFSVQFGHAVREVRQSTADDDHATPLLVVLDLPVDDMIRVAIGSSFIDAEQAERNRLDELTPEPLFDDVAADAAHEWTSALSQFSVEGGTQDQRTSFFSSLYRLFLYPSIAHERDESGHVVHRSSASSENPAGTVEAGTLTVNHGFWDTYRTAWPAYALFRPDLAARLLEGVLQHATDTGWIPRWAAPGAIDIMVGTSSDIVLAEAVVKAVPLRDPLAAFDTALRNATVPSADPAVGRKGLAEGRFRGYISTAVREGLSWTLENCIADAAVAAMAGHLMTTIGGSHPRQAELDATREYLHHRALEYAGMFDERTGFLRGRDDTGAFRHEAFRPEEWGGDYTETNAWGMVFAVPHDPIGLAALFGGIPALRARLDEFFATPERGDPSDAGSYGRLIHEMTEARNIRMGMFGLSNQPAHHIPYLYSYADAPHRTQAITREVLRRCFLGSEIGQGYPGDDDNGEMSAWYVFNALGLYPLAPWASWYALTTPLFESVSVALPSGAILRVIAHNQGPENDYIQSVRLNGVDWDLTYLPYTALADGAELEFILGNEPSRWGVGSHPPSMTAPDSPILRRRDASADGEFDGPRLLIDDAGNELCAVGPDDPLVWRHHAHITVRQYTITIGPSMETAPSSWRLEASDDGTMWTTLDERTDETFRWGRQLRPFTPRFRSPAALHRVVFTAPGQLAQIELLVDDDSSLPAWELQ